MMLPALATVPDLEVRIGKPIPVDQVPRAQAALVDASSLVRAEAGLNWVDALGELFEVPDIVHTITLAAAHRCYIGETPLNDPTLAGRMVTTASGRPLFLYASERRLLEQLPTGRTSAFSVSTVPAEVIDAYNARALDGWS